MYIYIHTIIHNICLKNLQLGGWILPFRFQKPFSCSSFELDIVPRVVHVQSVASISMTAYTWATTMYNSQAEIRLFLDNPPYHPLQ